MKLNPNGHELSLNGQTILNLGRSRTPSTVMGSPNDGSTRPYSSPSPALSPSNNDSLGGGSNSNLAHGAINLGNLSNNNNNNSNNQNTSSRCSDSPMELYMNSRIKSNSNNDDVSLQISMNFQEIY